MENEQNVNTFISSESDDNSEESAYTKQYVLGNSSREAPTSVNEEAENLYQRSMTIAMDNLRLFGNEDYTMAMEILPNETAQLVKALQMMADAISRIHEAMQAVSCKMVKHEETSRSVDEIVRELEQEFGVEDQEIKETDQYGGDVMLSGYSEGTEDNEFLEEQQSFRESNVTIDSSPKEEWEDAGRLKCENGAKEQDEKVDAVVNVNDSVLPVIYGTNLQKIDNHSNVTCCPTECPFEGANSRQSSFLDQTLAILGEENRGACTFPSNIYERYLIPQIGCGGLPFLPHSSHYNDFKVHGGGNGDFNLQSGDVQQFCTEYQRVPTVITLHIDEKPETVEKPVQVSFNSSEKTTTEVSVQVDKTTCDKIKIAEVAVQVSSGRKSAKKREVEVDRKALMEEEISKKINEELEGNLKSDAKSTIPRKSLVLYLNHMPLSWKYPCPQVRRVPVPVHSHRFPGKKLSSLWPPSLKWKREVSKKLDQKVTSDDVSVEPKVSKRKRVSPQRTTSNTPASKSEVATVSLPHSILKQSPLPTECKPRRSAAFRGRIRTRTRSDHMCERDPTPSPPSVKRPGHVTPSTAVRSPRSRSLSPKTIASSTDSRAPKRTMLGNKLLKAAQEGRTKDVRDLLREGADPNFHNHAKWTPLHMAALNCHLAVVAQLLERGADTSAVNSYGFSALHMASYNDHSGDCVSRLIYAGSELDAPNYTGRRPLHFAAEYDNEAAVRALLAAGADVTVRNDEGLTPFQVAQSDCVRRLLAPSTGSDRGFG